MQRVAQQLLSMEMVRLEELIARSWGWTGNTDKLILSYGIDCLGLDSGTEY